MNILIFAVVVFGIAAVIIVMTYKSVMNENGAKRHNTEKNEKLQKPGGGAFIQGKKSPDKWTGELIPIKAYDVDEDAYILDKGYMDILMIRSKDLTSANEDEVEYDCLKFAKLYKVYGDDLKLISMNFPCNTLKQQEYFRAKMEKAGNEVFKAWCKKKLDELIYLEKTTSREFYLMFFSKNIEEHKKNLATIFSTLGSGRDGLIGRIDAEKKHKILYKLNNKNALVS